MALGRLGPWTTVQQSNKEPKSKVKAEGIHARQRSRVTYLPPLFLWTDL